MKNLISLILVGFISLTFISCDDAPPPPQKEEVKNMHFTVSHKANGDDIVFADSIYTLPSGENITLTRLAYLLGEFSLVLDDDTEVKLDDQYVLVNPKFGASDFTLTDIPMGSYKAIKFSLGLDSSVNYGDPDQYAVDHPLSPINNALHWNWTGGYIFTAIEGKMADGSNESFVFHLAGSINKKDYTFPLSFVKSEDAVSVSFQTNFDEIFKNPEVFSLQTDGKSTHSISDPVTTKLFGNMGDIFTLSIN